MMTESTPQYATLCLTMSLIRLQECLRRSTKIEIDDWIEHFQIYKDPYNNLPALPTVVIAPPIAATVTIQEDKPISITTTQATIVDKDLGSIIVGGQQRSACAPAP
jgi:hypothetical protein